MESLGDILKRLTSKNSFAARGAYPEAEPEAEPEINCPLCRGTGWLRAKVPLGHPNFGKALPCECQYENNDNLRLERLQRYSNLGALRRITFDTTDSRGQLPGEESQSLFNEAMRASQEFADHPTGWLILMGPSGSGKTHLAAALTNRALELGTQAFFAVVPDLLDHLRASFTPNSDLAYDELFEQVRNVPLLILDDLASYASSPWAQEKLFQVFNHRYNAQLPTVVTLNTPVAELEQRLRTRLEDQALTAMYSLSRRVTPLLQQIGGLEEEMLRQMTFKQFDIQGNNAGPIQRTSLEAALAGAYNYARDPHGWLLLSGPTGCGKTHLAVAILNHRLEEQKPVLFAFVPTLLDHLRGTFAPSSEISYDTLFERIKTVPFLVLDDLGSESSTAWAEEKLYQIIVHRNNARLLTIISASDRLTQVTSSDQLSIKTAVISRLSDPRIVEELRIDAPDYRAQGSPKHQNKYHRRSV